MNDAQRLLMEWVAAWEDPAGGDRYGLTSVRSGLVDESRLAALAPEREETGLRTAAKEVLAADGAAETGDEAADRRWDEALERLRAALTAPVADAEQATA